MIRVNFFLVIFVLSGIIFSTSCSKDEFNDDYANIDSSMVIINDTSTTGITLINEAELVDSVMVDYTISVLPGDKVNMLKSSTGIGLEGVEITIMQNGASKKVTTDATGMANFNLFPGKVSVSIAKDGYSDMFLEVDLRRDDENTRNYTRSASSTILMIPTKTSVTLSGNMFYQQDVTRSYKTWSEYNNAYTESEELEKVPANKTKIVATINPEAYFELVSMNGDGAIVNVVLDSCTYEKEIKTEGTFEISLPKITAGLTFTFTLEAFDDEISYSAYQYDNDGNLIETADFNLDLDEKKWPATFEAYEFDEVMLVNKKRDIYFYYFGYIEDVDLVLSGDSPYKP